MCLSVCLFAGLSSVDSRRCDALGITFAETKYIYVSKGNTVWKKTHKNEMIQPYFRQSHERGWNIMKSLQLRFPLLNFRRKSRDRSLTLCYVLIQNAHHKVLNVNLRSNCGGSKSVPGIGQIYWGYLLVFFAGPGRPMGYWIECTWLHLSYLSVLQMRIWILYIPTYLPGTDCITYMTLDILCLVFVHVSITSLST